jgi:polysaccharide deacetylase 2 family uncharacterized protein YibQ
MTEKPTEETKDEAAAPAPAYKPKGPRNLLVGLAIFVLLVLLALGGLLTAIFSHSEDPASIKIPAHVARSLNDEAPTQEMTGAETDAAQPVQEVEMNLQGEEAQTPLPTPDMGGAGEQVAPMATPMPAPEQTESQIQLSPDAASGEEVPVLQPKKHPAPQSMIQWNDRPVAVHSSKAPKIALVIDDMGMNRRNSQRIVDLSGSLTLAYLPYAEDLQKQTSRAADKGHELIVHMPMQPVKMAGNNPGPNALLTALTPEQNLQRLNENLSRFEGYIGLNNHMGSDLTANREALQPIMAEIKRRGLWFLDSRTIGNSVAGPLAEEMGVPYASRDVFLDNAASVQSVLMQLKELEKIARHRGYAVGIGHPHEATITALQQWLPQVQAHGVEIVPLSTIIAQRYPDAVIPKYARLKGRTSLSQNAIESVAGKSL